VSASTQIMMMMMMLLMTTTSIVTPKYINKIVFVTWYVPIIHFFV